jgi:hypothetical protein
MWAQLFSMTSSSRIVTSSLHSSSLLTYKNLLRENPLSAEEGYRRAPAPSISRPRRPSLTIPLYRRILSTAVVALVVIALQIDPRRVDSPKIHRGRHSGYYFFFSSGCHCRTI